MLEPPPAPSRFLVFDRAAWAKLRDSTPLTLSEADLAELRGLNEAVSIAEVEEIYLPLSRLLTLYVGATQQLYRASQTFLGAHTDKVPFIIGLAGSVAVGKSTTARILQALLTRWPGHPTVDLVTTDGFLFPNAVLAGRGIMHRKGFPDSYDRAKLVRFLADLKGGAEEVEAPVYSHQRYDIVPGASHTVRHPDIVIVEGLNVLQTGGRRAGRLSPMFVSDFFDFSIYVDADERDIEQWYVERFIRLRETVFTNPSSYFHRYADLSHDDARKTAGHIWRTVNLVNLHDNVLPTRERAHLILEKGKDHGVRSVRLRKV